MKESESNLWVEAKRNESKIFFHSSKRNIVFPKFFGVIIDGQCFMTSHLVFEVPPEWNLSWGFELRLTKFKNFGYTK